MTHLAQQIDALGVLVIVGPFLLFVALGGVYLYRSTKRAADIRAWARERGYDVRLGDDHHFYKDHQHFDLFHAGTRRITSNVVRWSETLDGHDVEFIAGEHYWSRRSGDSIERHRSSFLIVRTPFPNMLATVLAPERAHHKVKASLGMNDIDFEDAAFSDRVHVWSASREFAYALLDPRMIDLLRNVEDLPVIDVRRSEILMTPPGARHLIPLGRHWSPARFEQHAKTARAIIERFPEHLARERAEPDSA